MGVTIPDSAAITLLGDVLDLEPVLLPPIEPADRNLLEHDLISTDKLHLLEQPISTEEDS